MTNKPKALFAVRGNVVPLPVWMDLLALIALILVMTVSPTSALTLSKSQSSHVSKQKTHGHAKKQGITPRSLTPIDGQGGGIGYV